MKSHRRDSSVYRGMPLQTVTKKFLSAGIDGALMLVLTVLFTLIVAFPVLKGNGDFTACHDTCFDEIYQMYRIQEEAKIRFLKEGSRKETIPQSELFSAYIDHQIRVSYLYHQEAETGNLSPEDDILAYYFIFYKSEKKIRVDAYGGKPPETYYAEDILFPRLPQEYYIAPSDSVLPVLNIAVAENLRRFQQGDAEQKELTDTFYSAFLEIRELAVSELLYYDRYAAHYQEYSRSLQQMSQYETVALIIVFSLVFTAVVALPEMLLRNTAGQFFTKSRRRAENDVPLSFLRRLLCVLLSFFSSAFLIVFASFFTFGFTNLSAVVVSLGIRISFLHILLLSFSFFLMQLAMICFDRRHVSFTERITKTRMVDIRNFIRSGYASQDGEPDVF